MPGYQIFIIRLLLGLGFSIVLVRIFRDGTDPVYIGGLTIILVGLAYFMEYLRKRKKP